MNSPKLLLFLVFLALLLFTGCYTSRQAAGTSSSVSANQMTNEGFLDVAQSETVRTEQVSLKHADQLQSMVEAMDRKILRNADLTLEVSSPGDAQRQVTSIAESVGGFVVTSESKQRDSNDPAKQELEVSLVVRVPALQFGSTLDRIRELGNRVILEKVTGQDVTEEFIDLEARIRTQKALEFQFLDIMKQANKVADALEVQRQIADVRTEIEKLEGRKRFLANRASLSTITISLKSPRAIAADTSGFGSSVRDAIAESVNVASSIVLFVIRFVVVMVPVFILVILPGLLVARFSLRRAKRWQLARAVESPSESDG